MLWKVHFTDHSLDQQIPAQPVRIAADSPANLPLAGSIHVNTGRRFQKIAGVGAAFSEIGTLALAALRPEQQSNLLHSLFDIHAGAGFSFCRLPIGSSDFATSAYSYAMTPEDYDLRHFSIARDERSIIPTVLAARRINPALTLQASPWSPPGWMKMSGRMEGEDDLCKLRDEDAIYKAYALYFEKYLRAYLAAGIPMARVCPQNEVDMNPKYPGCTVEPWQMVKFVNGYLAPQLKRSGLDTELWAGTFREGHKVEYAAECLKDALFRQSIAGLGVQYFKPEKVVALAQQYPGLGLMHTEARCSNGQNTADTAKSRLTEIITILNAGCDGYAYWNMMLDETRKSGWDWSQNSLVVIDRETGNVLYNPDYQPVFLVSRFVRPGDFRVGAEFRTEGDSGYSTPVSAFSGHRQTVVLCQNVLSEAVSLRLVTDQCTALVGLPPHSDCAVVCDDN